MANSGDGGGAAGKRAEDMIGENRTDGPSRLTDVDRMALDAPKSKWQEASAPAAGDPVSEDELRGLSLLGGSSLRDGTIPGVSDPVRDGTGGPHERPGEEATAGPGQHKASSRLDLDRPNET